MKTTMFTIGMAAALLAGCSSDDLTVDGGGSVTKGQAYVGLSLQLPSTTGGRADEDQANDRFGDGSAAEYAVKDITVVFIKNDNNTDKVAEVFSTIDGLGTKFAIPAPWTNPAPDGNVTTSATLPVMEVKDDADRKVLVIINNNDRFGTGDGKVALTEGTELSKVTEAMTSVTADNFHSAQGGFFMTNAPLLESSSATTATTYVQVKPSTSEEIAKAQAKDIYVERAVARVDVSVTGNNDNTLTVADDQAYAGDQVNFTGWVLDITNKSTFPVRQVDDAWFAADYNSWFKGGNTTSPIRTYFAKDNNYDTYSEDLSSDFDMVTSVTDGMTGPKYCLENTFDTPNQKQDRTTRIVLKAKYTPAQQSDEEQVAEEGTAAGNLYRLGNSSKLYTEAALLAELKTLLQNDNLTLTHSAFTAGDNTLSASNSSLQESDLQDANAKVGTIICYKNSECYYVVRIQHFGDKYCAWTNTDNYVAEGVSDDLKKKYLGRYGVVRNNWYEIEIQSVSAPGSPTIPEPTDEADDVTKYYLQTKVNILSWAKRKQNVHL